MGGNMKKNKTAIVIASFGTTYPSGLKSIINIINHVKKEFPETTVKVTFTSNIIKHIWEKRQREAQKWLSMGVPKEILYVKGMIATLGELSDHGYKTIIIQPTHIYHGEEFSDVLEYVKALNSIQTIKKKWRPFTKIVVGRPALGTYGPEYDYHEDIVKGVKALKADVELAKKKGAILVYMGHGNEFFSTGIYAETQKEFRKQYPDVQTFIGTVEGYPSLDDVVMVLKSHAKSKKIVLKPFMIVAGDHANNDMAGDEPDSWKNVLQKAGFTVYPVIEGLGSNNNFAEIFVEHIKDVVKDNGIKFK
jgi:sirohydrochlorin cobaltochelatase